MTAVELAGSVAVVTGADSGIGYATATRLVHAGADVVATDIKDGEGMAALATAGATTRRCDVTDAGDRAALAAAVGEVALLVNAAGVIGSKPIDEVVEDDWDRQLGTNAKATFFLSQQIGGAMRPGGAIVNVSSISARRAVNTESAVYAASKAAVLSITRSFAHAYADRHIRVNAVLPGLIDTPMQERLLHDMAAARGADLEELRGARTAGVPLARTGTPDEVAEVICWLLAPGSAYVTGQSITADGGLTMF
ncbi:MAG: SDR family oxidoreductase [Streptosporangiales bacterium]|nr:SDR family oxidoreductase [Streptosporangiales bacterium]